VPVVKILKSDGLEVSDVKLEDTAHLPNTLILDDNSKLEFNSPNSSQLSILNAGAGEVSLKIDDALEVRNPDGQSHIDIHDGREGKPAYITLYADNGTPYYLFTEPNGRLRIGTVIPTSNLDGDIVGEQG
jgi:hypothetical protein